MRMSTSVDLLISVEWFGCGDYQHEMCYWLKCFKLQQNHFGFANVKHARRSAASGTSCNPVILDLDMRQSILAGFCMYFAIFTKLRSISQFWVFNILLPIIYFLGDLH